MIIGIKIGNSDTVMPQDMHEGLSTLLNCMDLHQNKIKGIKGVRTILRSAGIPCGLKDAKEYVEHIKDLNQWSPETTREWDHEY